MHASPPQHGADLPGMQQRFNVMHLNSANASRTRPDDVEFVTLGEDRTPVDVDSSGLRLHYEGYMLQRAPVAAGEKKSWQSVRKERLPLSSDELANEVKQLQRKGVSITSRLQDLGSNARQQVKQVVSDKNNSERDRRVRWTLAAIRIKNKQTGLTTVEIASISVILERVMNDTPASMPGGAGAKMSSMDKAHFNATGALPSHKMPQPGHGQEFGGQPPMGPGANMMPKQPGMGGMPNMQPNPNHMPHFAQGPGGPAPQQRDHFPMHGAPGMKPQGMPEMMPGMKQHGMPEMMPGMKQHGMPEMPGMKPQGMPGMPGMMPGHGAPQFAGGAAPHGAPMPMAHGGQVPGMHGAPRNEPHITIPVAPPGASKGPAKQFPSQMPPVPPPPPAFPGPGHQMPQMHKMPGAPQPGAFNDPRQPKPPQMHGGLGLGMGPSRKNSMHQMKPQMPPDIFMVSDSECSSDGERSRESDEETFESGRTKATSVWSGPHSPSSTGATKGSSSTIKPSLGRRASTHSAKHPGGGRRSPQSRHRNRESKGSLASYDEEDSRYREPQQHRRRRDSLEREPHHHRTHSLSRRDSIERMIREKLREEENARREKRLLDEKVQAEVHRRMRQEEVRRQQDALDREEDEARLRERAARLAEASLRLDPGLADDHLASDDLFRRRAALRRQANLARNAPVEPEDELSDAAYRRLRRSTTAPASAYDDHLQGGRRPARSRGFFDGWS